MHGKKYFFFVFHTEQNDTQDDIQHPRSGYTIVEEGETIVIKRLSSRSVVSMAGKKQPSSPIVEIQEDEKLRHGYCAKCYCKNLK